jgi:hypothetical protein
LSNIFRILAFVFGSQHLIYENDQLEPWQHYINT